MKKPFTNTGKTTLHIDGKRIEPNQTRDVDHSMIPEAYLHPSAEQNDEGEAPRSVTSILDKNIPVIIPLLPGLTDEQLAEVKAAEEAGKTRSGLMNAIAEEELKRADAKVPNPGAETDDGAAGSDEDAGGDASEETESTDK